MKKIIILALGLCAATAANAQDVRLGVKAGLNLPNIIRIDGNDNVTSTKVNPGFNAGVTLDIPLTTGIAFTPEVLFASKGYKGETLAGEFTQTTYFIDVPILASFKIAGSGLNIVAGPQVSFLTSTKNKLETGLGTIESQYNEDSDRFKKSLLGGVVGPQVSFLTSTKNKFENGFGTVESEYNEDSDKFKKSLLGGVIGLRYDINDKFDIHGRYALDFQKNNEDGTSRTPEYKNQVFSVGVGVKF